MKGANIDLGKFGNGLVAGTVSGFAAGAAASLARAGRITVEQVATDAFGNALGSSLADAATSSGEQEAAQREAELNREDELAQQAGREFLRGGTQGGAGGPGGWFGNVVSMSQSMARGAAPLEQVEGGDAGVRVRNVRPGVDEYTFGGEVLDATPPQTQQDAAAAQATTADDQQASVRAPMSLNEPSRDQRDALMTPTLTWARDLSSQGIPSDAAYMAATPEANRFRPALTREQANAPTQAAQMLDAMRFSPLSAGLYLAKADPRGVLLGGEPAWGVALGFGGIRAESVSAPLSIGIRSAGSTSWGPVYRGVEITDARGSPLGEFDKVEAGLLVEEKSAQGLQQVNPRTGEPVNTADSWAARQIYDKTVTRIENLNNAAATRASVGGTAEVPTLAEIQEMKALEFRIQSAAPEVRAAVDVQLQNLRAKYPEWTFGAKYGK
jgi:hypothetical protein